MWHETKCVKRLSSKILGYSYNASWIHRLEKYGWDLLLKESVVINVQCMISMLKGHWTSITSSPTFSKKSWDFYTIRSVGMGKDYMLSFTFQIDLLLKKPAYF